MNFSEFGLFGVLFPIVFISIFLIVIVTFIVVAVKGIKQWNKNNHSPRLTIPAMIVSKRIDVSYHSNRDKYMSSSSSTRYYVTFQVESGDRIELKLSGTDYGQLSEGDQGDLTFQGTRYLNFQRNNVL